MNRCTVPTDRYAGEDSYGIDSLGEHGSTWVSRAVVPCDMCPAQLFGSTILDFTIRSNLTKPKHLHLYSTLRA